MAPLTFSLIYSFLELALLVQQGIGPGAAGAPTLDKLPLPAGAIIVIMDDLKKALDRMEPTGVLLSPEQYQALRDEIAGLKQKIARLESQLAPAKGQALFDTCLLRGQAVGDVLELRAELKFKSNSDNAVIPVGFKGAKITSASLDGDTPIWGPDQDGLTLQLKEAKVYQLVLEMRLKIARMDPERSVFVHLPRAAITKLEAISLPERAENVLINKGAAAVKVEYPERGRARLSADALGAIEQLEISWQARSGKESPIEPKVGVQGDLRISMGDNSAETDARVLIEPQRGVVSSLRFRLADPAGSRASVMETEEERTGPGKPGEPRQERLRSSFDSQSQVLTLSFDPPLSAAERAAAVRIRWQQTYAKKPSGETNVIVPLGLMALLDMPGSSQKGTITVSRTSDVGIEFPDKDVQRIDPPEPAGGARGAITVAAFRYWRQPLRLDASVTLLEPAIDVRAQHKLDFTGRTPRLISEFTLEVSRAGIREVEAWWPAGLKLDRVAPPSLVEEWRLDAATSLVRIALRPHRPPFKAVFTMEGSLAMPGASEMTAALPFVRHGYRERGEGERLPVSFRRGDVAIVAPDDQDVRLQPGATGISSEAERPALPGIIRGTTRYVQEINAAANESGTAKPPWQMALTWRTRQFEVENLVDSYLTQTELQVQQTVHYQFERWAPPAVTVQVPRSIERLVQVHLQNGGAMAKVVLNDVTAADDLPAPKDASVMKVVNLPKGLAGACRIVFDYRLDLPKKSGAPAGDRLDIPHVRPLDGRTSAARARIWTSSTVRVTLEKQTAWQPTPPGLSASGDGASPALELRSNTGNAPLRLLRTTTQPAAIPDVLAERVYVNVISLPEGKWAYRARFRFSRIRADSLEVTLPNIGQDLILRKVLLDGREARAEIKDSPPGGDGQPAATFAHIPIEPRLLARAAELEVHFDLERVPGRWWSIANLRNLPAPELAGRAAVDRVQWRLELPPGSFPLSLSAEYVAEQPWRWRGLLLAPQPLASLSDTGARQAESDGRGDSPDQRLAFSFSRLGGMSGLSILYFPERLWLLICSFSVLVPGILLYCFPPRQPLLWLALLGVGLTAIGMLQPAWLAALAFGAQPGLIVLGLFATLFWMGQRRWRRKVVLLPGFARLKTESSVHMLKSPSSVVRPRTEPSTVDAPKAVGPPSSELNSGAGEP